MEKTRKRRNTFFQGSLKLLIGIGGIVALISTFLCAICPFVNPSIFVWTAIFGLAFWMIFFVNIFILIILIRLKSRRTILIPIVALLFSIPGLLKSYSFGKEKDSNAQIKVMTYNVGVFRDYNDKNRSANDVKKTLAELVEAEKPDVLCLQESGQWPENAASAFSKMIGYKYYSINKANGNSYFSKYPLLEVKAFDNEGLIKFVDIKKVKINNEDSFYLVNCHFNSFKISDDIDDINEKEVCKSVIRKLVNGFMSRTEITELLLKKLPDDKLPIVICGDFNDTPMSYTYNKMFNAGLKDAFITVSKGIGKTYCGKLPLLRIDYFWYNDYVEVVSYKRIKQTTSDHYPLVMDFNITKAVEENE